MILDPNQGQPIAVYGEAVSDRGLVVREAIDGLGIVSSGLLWQCAVIWLNETAASAPTTSWTNASSTVTTWTNESLPTTTWTNDSTQKGFFGEC